MLSLCPGGCYTLLGFRPCRCNTLFSFCTGSRKEFVRFGIGLSDNLRTQCLLIHNDCFCSFQILPERDDLLRESLPFGEKIPVLVRQGFSCLLRFGKLSARRLKLAVQRVSLGPDVNKEPVDRFNGIKLMAVSIQPDGIEIRFIKRHHIHLRSVELMTFYILYKKTLPVATKKSSETGLASEDFRCFVYLMTRGVSTPVPQGATRRNSEPSRMEVMEALGFNPCRIFTTSAYLTPYAVQRLATVSPAATVCE